MAFISSISFTGDQACVHVTDDEVAAPRGCVSGTSSTVILRDCGPVVPTRLSPLDSIESKLDEVSVAMTPRHEVFYRPFYEECPETYFLAVELDFELERIVSQREKFSHVCKVLEPKHFHEIGPKLPLITSPSCYDDLKRVLIKHYSPTPAQKFADLFDSLGEGMSPQELKDKIVNAFGMKSDDCNLEDFKRELFLRHIPSKIALPLRAFVDDSFEKTVDRARAMFETRPSVTNNYQDHTTTSRMQEQQKLPKQSNEIKNLDDESQSGKLDLTSIQKQTDKLTKIATTLSSNSEAQASTRNLYRSNYRQRGRFAGTRKYQPNNQWWLNGIQAICYYHSKFGIAARNCADPCTFLEEMGFSPLM